MEKNSNIKNRKLQGIVTSVTPGNNFKIRVETKKPHPKYGKIVRSHKSYVAKNTLEEVVNVGDVVTIQEHKPLSKQIKFVLLEKVTR